jgi:hypothetical protein
MLKLPSSRLTSGLLMLHLAATGIVFVGGCGPATKTAIKSHDEGDDEEEGKKPPKNESGTSESQPKNGNVGGSAESQPSK